MLKPFWASQKCLSASGGSVPAHMQPNVAMKGRKKDNAADVAG